MRTNQKIRTIIRSQDAPYPEPGVIWIYKTVQQTDEGEIEVLVMNYYENGEWKPIASTVDGHIIPSGEVTKKDLADLKELLEKEIKDVEDSSLSETQEITYAELVALRTDNKLVPGKTYRITDYVATTVQSGTRSANHPFDVIVTALSSNTLAEEAKAAIHKGDPYFGACKLNSWRIWYALDNDTNRFAWADAAYGKGVIYRMIDEYDNDLPYDFKGIQFARYEIRAFTDAIISPSMSPLVGLKIAASNNNGITVDTTKVKWYYTFSRLYDSWDTEATDASFNAFTSHVVFASDDFSDPQNHIPVLLNNVFAYGPVVDVICVAEGATPTTNFFFTYFTHLKFNGSHCRDNTFIGPPGLSNIGNTFRRNLIVGAFRHMNIASNFQDNNIFTPNDFASCEIGDSFSKNNFYCKGLAGPLFFEGNFRENSIALTGNCQSSSFGEYFHQNKITGDTLNRIVFGVSVGRNTFSDIYLGSTQIMGQLMDCTFSGKFISCSFNPICGYCDFKGGTNGNTCTGLDVVGNIRGTSSARVNVENTTDFICSDANNIKRRIRLEGDTNGNMIMSYWSEGKWIRKTKGLTGSNWVEIVDEETILKSPNGTKFRITVDNSGNIQSTQITE